MQFQSQAEFIFKDTILAITRYNNMRTEYENLLKYKKGLLFTSAIYFFNTIMDANDVQLYFLMVIQANINQNILI